MWDGREDGRGGSEVVEAVSVSGPSRSEQNKIMDEIKQELDEPGRAAGTRSVAEWETLIIAVLMIQLPERVKFGRADFLPACALSCRAIWNHFI